MNDSDPLVCEALGTYWCKLGQAAADREESRQYFERGLGYYGRAISIRPTYRNLQARGACRISLGDVAGSLNDLNRSHEMHPYFASTLFHRGWAYFLLDKLDRAIADLDEAVKYDAKHWLLWQSRGVVLAKLNRPAEAIESLERALKCDPPPPPAMQARIDADLEKLRATKPPSDF